MFRSGQYLEQPALPARLGYEAAGIVESVGPGVTDLKPGDAVSTIPAFSMNQYGVYGDLVLAPVHAVAKHPAVAILERSRRDLDAVSHRLRRTRSKSPNSPPATRILIPAASSSVGLAAIQIANSVGATPIALTRKSNKRDELAEARRQARHRHPRARSRRRSDETHQG